jgi:hypothetical protein
MDMTDIPPDNSEPVPEKMQIDNPSNFQFHAAYLAYSELFDNAPGLEVKRELNKNIEDLKEGVISPELFYANISRFRGAAAPDRRHRFSVQTQRKRDWRMKSQKQDRIKRHKK